MFSQKKLKFAFGIFLVIVAIFSIVQLPLLALPVLGGVITQGILGGFSGKVGPVVGGKWKDIDYMRGYVVPANPNTTAQQTVRAKFAKLISIAKSALSTLINVYWDPFYSNMSGFNAFVSANYAESTSAGVFDTSCKITKGSLEPLAGLTSAVIVGTTLTITWNESINGNGLGTDSLKCCIYHTLTDSIEFFDMATTRDASPKALTVTTETLEDDICFVFAHRGTGASFVVSDSLAVLVTT